MIVAKAVAGVPTCTDRLLGKSADTKLVNEIEVVFSSMETSPLPKFAVTKSSLPSSLKSPIASIWKRGEVEILGGMGWNPVDRQSLRALDCPANKALLGWRRWMICFGRTPVFGLDALND
jgi:hypothetical protein